jgi:hypothetical protein
MKVLLKARFATAQDTAKALGVSAPRFRRLVKVAATTIAKNGWSPSQVKTETAHEPSARKRQSRKKSGVSDQGHSRGKASKAR